MRTLAIALLLSLLCFSPALASPLTDAVFKGDVNSVKELINTGTDVNSKNQNGVPALVMAAYLGNAEIVKLLLEGGANVNDRISGGWNGFMQYVERVKAGKQPPTLTLNQFIPDMRIDPNNLPRLIGDQEEELNAIMVASFRGYEDVVDLLLERKADLGANTKRGWSPLIFAATRNYPSIVEKLIKAGAGVDHRDKSMNTALIYAVLSGSNDSVKILLANGASTDDKLFSPVKYSPLQLAAALKNFQAVQYLVEAGADINFTGLSIKNAFVFAVENGDYQTVKYFVEKGCDINTNGLTGPSPLKIAKTKGYKDIAQLLIQHKASE